MGWCRVVGSPSKSDQVPDLNEKANLMQKRQVPELNETYLVEGKRQLQNEGGYQGDNHLNSIVQHDGRGDTCC